MYKTIHEVPRGLRFVNGAPLTLAQVNTLVSQAENGAKKDGSDFAARLGVAKQQFREQHDMVSGHWVSKGGET